MFSPFDQLSRQLQLHIINSQIPPHIAILKPMIQELISLATHLLVFVRINCQTTRICHIQITHIQTGHPRTDATSVCC